MVNPQAEIELQEEIPLLLAVTDGKGNIVPGATISNVVWNETNQLGIIAPDPENPAKAVFKPNKPGTVNFTATATITIG